MKFLIRLDIQPHKFGNLLPLNYQYELSSFIYRTLAQSDEQYSGWLHENGYKADRKQFRLFSFSNLIIPEFKITDDRIRILSARSGLIISFLPEKSTVEFVNGIFRNQSFTIGDRKSKVAFSVSSIEQLRDPDFSQHGEFVTLSPVCIMQKNERQKHPQYLSPQDEFSNASLFMNLSDKYRAFYNIPYAGDAHFELTVRNRPHSKLITIKRDTPQQTSIKGYNFSFGISASPELKFLMYHTGLGQKNSMGFGCVLTKDQYEEVRNKL
ncbi:MAG: CRISPR-associated endoribonuclease Cas6 [Paludibacter sp.]|nr:CRISPR-associated endoribonuclease Cas6 [Paludibacter sp.]